MKKVLWWVVWGLLASAAAAQEPAPDEPEGTFQATGTLTTYNAAVGLLTLARRNGTESYKVSTTTKVLIDAEPASPAALPLDHRVRVIYRKEGSAPYPAVKLLDAASIVILTAERDGVPATIDEVTEGTDGAAKVPLLRITTSQGKHRELLVRDQGGWAAEILKDGQPAKLSAFAKGETVTLSVRRTGRPPMYLKSLADPPTYDAFLADRRLTGRIAAVAEDGQGFGLAVTGEATTQGVTLTRRTVYFTEGKQVEVNPFKVGDDVVVKFSITEHGVAIAQAVHAPGDWRVYADWVAQRR